MGKPNGLTVLNNKPEIIEKIKLLPVSYIWGVGHITKKELNAMGIDTIGDLADSPTELIKARFGELGKVIHDMANGIDDREVIPNREVKSIGREVTYRKDIDDFSILRSTLLLLSQKIARNMRLKGFKGKIVTLKVRFSDFKTISRRITLKQYTYGIFDIQKSAISILKNIDLERKKIRLIGVSISGLVENFMLDTLIPSNRSKDESLTEAIDTIANKFGENKLTLAKIIKKDDIFD
jgi:DNA polymerase-4